MPVKVKGPSLAIGGRKYVLSDYWMMSEDLLGPPSPGGAKLIDTGGSRFRYLWLYDTDKQVVAMWRASDGDEKAHDRVSHFTSQIYILEKRKQLNRVTHAEFQEVSRFMAHRADETLRSMKKLIEETATDWDRQVAAILDSWFKKEIKPDLDRRISELKSGVIPFGFKVNEAMLPHKNAIEQATTFLVSKAFERYNENAAYDYVSKVTGVDAWEPPNGDSQAVQWGWHELYEKAHDALR